MGLLDILTGAVSAELGQSDKAAMPNLMSAALATTNFGDLQGLVNQLQQGPLAAQVQSWIGGGQNLPITADQLRTVLSDDHVQQLAQHFGIDTNAVLGMLAQHLPTAVEQASQQGTVSA
jgi:uncharacterized protein YidB (DUF937 family)